MVSGIIGHYRTLTEIIGHYRTLSDIIGHILMSFLFLFLAVISMIQTTAFHAWLLTNPNPHRVRLRVALGLGLGLGLG